MKLSRKQQFTKDEEWGSYWEFELNKFIEPYFNTKVGPDKLFSFSTLRSSDIYKNKKDWWRFDTLYHIYKNNDPHPIRDIKFEIKTDKYENTGNICIEKKCSKKLSGVFHTEADYFIYYMPRYREHNLYLFKPKMLIEFLEKNYNNYLMYVGDNDLSYSYIINKNDFDTKVLDEKIGKIFTLESEIPSKFGVEKFEKVNKTTYKSSGLRDYEDPFKWEE